MRSFRAPIVICWLVALLAVPAGATVVGSRADGGPRQLTSPPGQVVVTTINAKQQRILDVERFQRLYDLVLALRTRPPAFDGGYHGAVTVPDVVVLQEMSSSNAEIFQRLLRQHFSYRYTVFGSTGSAAKLVVNEDTVQIQGEPVVWSDVCTSPETPSDGWPERYHQFARFTETGTAAPFVVAGVELAATYGEDTTRCVLDNVAELRRQLESEPAPAIIAGDFNKRPTSVPYECDPNEQSEPTAWWSMLTSPADPGKVYVDAVQSSHRARGVAVDDEWTFQSLRANDTCLGRGIRRARIDYLFSTGADVGAAHADHPGWAGATPGTKHPHNPRYSDHRFVWGRFAVSAPAQPQRPMASPLKGGAVSITWPVPQQVEGRMPASAFKLYRAAGHRGYTSVATLDPAAASYIDVAPRHGVAYRYALVPVGAGDQHGVESRPGWVVPDGRGPQVRRVRPYAGSYNVDRRAVVRAFFDERIDATSVGPAQIAVYRKAKRIGGRVAVLGRSLTFDPHRPLKPKRTYKAIVYPVNDALGNRGARFSWTFST